VKMDYYELRAFRKFIERIENKKHKAILGLAFFDGLRVKEIAGKLSVKLAYVQHVLKKHIEKFNRGEKNEIYKGNKKQAA